MKMIENDTLIRLPSPRMMDSIIFFRLFFTFPTHTMVFKTLKK